MLLLRVSTSYILVCVAKVIFIILPVIIDFKCSCWGNIFILISCKITAKSLGCAFKYVAKTCKLVATTGIKQAIPSDIVILPPDSDK